MIYSLLHPLLLTLYVLAPIVLVVAAFWTRRQGLLLAAILTVIAGTFVGVALTLLYARLVGAAMGTDAPMARVSIPQMAIACYAATALVAVLRGLDGVLIWITRRWLRLGRAGRRPRGHGALAVASLVRAIVLILIGLPVVMSAAITFRPKVVPQGTPYTQWRLPYERVSFSATDGLMIAGWWIGGSGSGPGVGRTVVFCHGLGTGKQELLDLAGTFHAQGYGVLLIDHRAHGESDGQFTTFGDAERYDVLGAVRWLRQNRRIEASRIFGVGISTGAAALVAAAAHDSDDGRAIDAVALFATYDDLPTLAADLARTHFLPPFSTLLRTTALQLVSAHAGRDLLAFSPADLIDDIWPRPILIIHGARDGLIPLERGQALYDAAYFPREHLWLVGGRHESVSRDLDALWLLHDFFARARPWPII
ncbi:MAG TPA: alpha/beta fold hydrolase [Tepidisphaeraceae bacterium]|nr:alpha/beta fold hydrolase [Tepidisphaeraceae bacterium]